MTKFRASFLVVAAVTAIVPVNAANKDHMPKMSASTFVIVTNLGSITVELDPVAAPVSSKNFAAYVDAKFYDGLVFHRVIPGFMIQGGGMTEDMSQKRGGAGIKNESLNGLKNLRGTLAMARTADPDSATSQFFINLKDNDFLNGSANSGKVGYAVFGKVTAGMDVVDKIAAVKTGTRGMYQDVPTETVVIQSIRPVGR